MIGILTAVAIVATAHALWALAIALAAAIRNRKPL
jgi:hypothetical protein